MRKIIVMALVAVCSVSLFAETPEVKRFVPVDALVEHGIKEVTNPGEGVYYTPNDTRTWDIGVIYTKNTKYAIECLQYQKEDGIRYKNYGVYKDVNIEYLFAQINGGLNRYFKRQIRVQSVPEKSDMVKYYVYVDLLIDLNGRSGAISTLTVNLYFVNKNNELLGKLTTWGEGLVGFPATEVGVMKAARDLGYNMDVFLEGGLDFCKP